MFNNLPYSVGDVVVFEVDYGFTLPPRIGVILKIKMIDSYIQIVVSDYTFSDGKRNIWRHELRGIAKLEDTCMLA